MTLTRANKYLNIIGNLTLFLLVTYMTISVLKSNGILDWVTNSDQTTLPSFVNEILKNPAKFGGWMQPREPLFFPDGLAYGITKVIFGASTILPVALAAIPTLFSFVFIASYLTGWKNQGKLLTSHLVSALILLVLPFALCLQDPSMEFWLLKYYFTFANHFSAAVATILTSVYLYNRKFVSILRMVPISISVFLFSFSDLIYTIYFLPILIIYLFSNIRNFRQSRDRGVLIKSTLFFSLIIAGNFFRQTLNIAYFNPISLSPTIILHNLGHEARDIYRSFTSSPSLTVFLLFTVGYYLFLIKQCIQELIKSKSQILASKDNVFMSLRFSISFSAFMSFFVSGVGWENASSIRYLIFFFFVPLVFVPSFILDNLRKLMLSNSALRGILTTTSGLGLACCVLWATPASALSNYDSYAKKATTNLSKCIQAAGGHKGLAGYWNARQIQFLSNGSIKLAQLAPYKTQPTSLLFYWANNILDYYDQRAPSDNLNYILMNNLDAPTVESAFGKPSSIKLCDGHEIWFFLSLSDITSSLVRNNTIILASNMELYRYLKVPGSFFSSQKPQYNGLKLVVSGSLESTIPILYGQYLPIKQGLVDFDLKYSVHRTSASKPQGHLYFDLATNTGHSVLVTRELSLSPGANEQRIQISTKDLNSIHGIEPRLLLSNSNAKISIESLEIRQHKAG